MNNNSKLISLNFFYLKKMKGWQDDAGSYNKTTGLIRATFLKILSHLLKFLTLTKKGILPNFLSISLSLPDLKKIS
jgi:hypothetical protein